MTLQKTKPVKRPRTEAVEPANPRSRKPTIYDIAAKSGASPSTVSAVLSGKSGIRRIGKETVRAIEAIAAEAGYSPNMQARGLRRARSGLAGMIIPMHENRFFSSLSQSFDTRARARGHCPVIASTLRDPKEEARVVETLISYKVDTLFIAGATDPAGLGALCVAARLPHVFIDLPGESGPSAVTDNAHGGELLAAAIMGRAGAGAQNPCFFGGNASDHATAARLRGFRAAAARAGLAIDEGQVALFGYAPRAATHAIEAMCGRLGGLPSALFVNSLTVFEGVLAHFAKLPADAFARCAIGLYDYDPIAALLQFPVTMVRQNSDQLIAKGYELLDAGDGAPRLIEVQPELIAPRTFHSAAPSEIG